MSLLLGVQRLPASFRQCRQGSSPDALSLIEDSTNVQFLALLEFLKELVRDYVMECSECAAVVYKRLGFQAYVCPCSKGTRT